MKQKVTSKQNKSQRVKQKEYILPEIPLGDEEWNLLSNHCLVKAENMGIELEEVKLNFNHVQDENEQNKKKIRDLKNYIQNVKDTNEELVDELERQEDEIRHLKNCVKNRDDMADGLEEV